MKRLALLALLSAACAPVVSHIPLNASPRPLAPRPFEEVEIFTASAPSREFVEVAIVTASPGSYGKNGAPLGDPAKLVESVRQRGAELGCDAVVVRPATGHGYQGTCLVYR